LLEVSEFYRHFGLQMSQEEAKRELPDHLCAELEFLHFLTFQKRQAVIDGKPEVEKKYCLAQKDFLDRHMIQWITKFSDRLQSSAGVSFYAQLARMTSLFITYELELVTSKR
jgi:DMSO reductase family type II enzyme chaperone